MREILFRGKCTANGKWVYGDLLNVGVDYDYAIRTYGGREHGQVNAVNEKTVGQYTGLTDKNGKRIWEGDIVKTYKFNTPNKKYIIKFDLLLGAFIGESADDMYFTTFDGDSDCFEIIGNIHDNPELLEGGAE